MGTFRFDRKGDICPNETISFYRLVGTRVPLVVPTRSTRLLAVGRGWWLREGYRVLPQPFSRRTGMATELTRSV